MIDFGGVLWGVPFLDHQDTIKILDSDKSLDLFRGRASFLQTSKDRSPVVVCGLLPCDVLGRDSEVNFLTSLMRSEVMLGMTLLFRYSPVMSASSEFN